MGKERDIAAALTMRVKRRHASTTIVAHLDVGTQRVNLDIATRAVRGSTSTAMGKDVPGIEFVGG